MRSSKSSRVSPARAGDEVGERALDAVAHRRPAVLVDPPGVVRPPGSRPRRGGRRGGGSGRARRRRRRARRRRSTARRARAARACRRSRAGAARTTSGARRARCPTRSPQLQRRRRTTPSSGCSGGTPWRCRLTAIVGRIEARPVSRPGVEGRVGGQRGELGQVRAQRVVDGQRAVRAAERDVQVQAGDELAARPLAVLGQRAHVARVVGQDAELGGERVRARGHQPADRLRGGRQVAARLARATATADATSAHGGVTISSCAAGSSSLKRGSSVDALDHLARVREQVERLGVEQEELLLDADPELVRTRRSARAARPAFTSPSRRGRRAAFGPPWNG